MDMYKVGKVVDLTANTTTSFNTSAQKHKAVLFQNSVAANYNVVFHDQATSSPGGITLSFSGTAPGNDPYILPCVVKSITPSANSRVILLG